MNYHLSILKSELSLAAMFCFVSLAGCTRTLATDEYVPFLLDALESRGIFDDPIIVVDEALEMEKLPPSWQNDPSVSVRFLPSRSIAIGPHLPDSGLVYSYLGNTYRGDARIVTILEEDGGFLEILLSATIPRFLPPLFYPSHGVAIVHARTRDDARVIAYGSDARELESASIRVVQELLNSNGSSQTGN